MLRVKKDSTLLEFPIPINRESIEASRDLPGLISRKGALVTVDASMDALEYILKHYNDVDWTDDAKELYVDFQLEEQAQAKPLTTDFEFKLPPYAHQLKAWDISKDEEVFALLMDMGTGKTKVFIDTAAYLVDRGKIDSVIGIAPFGVHHNWLLEEFPKHWPDTIPMFCATWSSDMRAAERDRFNKACNTRHAFVIFNVEGIGTKKGRAAMRRFMSGRECIIFVDESTRIKTPSAKRTLSAMQARKACKYRRILTGSVAPNGPFDLYSQFKFLDERILGFKTFQTFKFQYGIFEKVTGFDGAVKKDRRGQDIERAVAYKNVEDIHEKLRPYSFRVTKEECLDLPAKIYKRHRVQMSSEQWLHYERLKEDFFTEFEGQFIATEIALTRLIRFRQITGGFLDGIAFKQNPKMDDFMNLAEDYTQQCIVWASFVPEMQLLQDNLGDKAVWYKGGDKATALAKFKGGGAQFFIANPQSAGLGLTITEATLTTYYSNSHNYEHRVQSEDRNHRIGQENHVTYTDMIADGTCDVDILASLLKKDRTSALINGEEVRKWLQN